MGVSGQWYSISITYTLSTWWYSHYDHLTIRQPWTDAWMLMFYFCYTVYLKNFHDSSEICPMGFINSIEICEISHQTFGPSHRKCPICPMIFMNTGSRSQYNPTSPSSVSATVLRLSIISQISFAIFIAMHTMDSAWTLMLYSAPWYISPIPSPPPISSLFSS